MSMELGQRFEGYLKQKKIIITRFTQNVGIGKRIKNFCAMENDRISLRLVCDRPASIVSGAQSKMSYLLFTAYRILYYLKPLTEFSRKPRPFSKSVYIATDFPLISLFFFFRNVSDCCRRNFTVIN